MVMDGNHVMFGPEWNLIFTLMWTFNGDKSECHVAMDLVQEKPGREREKALCE